MRFQVDRDEKGKPVYVHTDDGFCARPYNEEEDGWMLDQLDPYEFPAVRHGNDVLALIREVNSLRRELFHANKLLKMYQGR